MITVGVHMSIHEEANRTVGNRTYRGDNLICQRRELVVNQEYTIVASADTDIAACTFEVINVFGYRMYFNDDGIEILLRVRWRSACNKTDRTQNNQDNIFVHSNSPLTCDNFRQHGREGLHLFSRAHGDSGPSQTWRKWPR